MTAVDLAAELADLDSAARHHKRQAARHRRKARDCRTRQRAIEAECRRLGIDFTELHAGEGNTHGQNNPRTRHTC